MNFYARRRRHAPAIIIISLIDVLIVMLVFLLVTTTYRTQPAIRLTLPQTSDIPKPGATTDPIPLVVTIPRGDAPFYVGKEAMDEAGLEAALVAAARRDPQTRLVLRADAESSWNRVARVIDIATKKAKLTNLKAYTRSPNDPTER